MEANLGREDAQCTAHEPDRAIGVVAGTAALDQSAPAAEVVHHAAARTLPGEPGQLR